MTGTGLWAGSAAAGAVIVAGARLRRRRDARGLPQRGDLDERAGGRGWPVAIVGAGVLAVAAGTVALGPVTTAAVIATGAIIVVRRRRHAERSRIAAAGAAMPDAVELLVVCLHAGLTPSQAIAELARLAPPPVRPGFLACEQRLHRGGGFADSLTELHAHCGPSALSLVSALGTAVRDGLPLTPVLDRLTVEAHAERRRAGEAAARRLPVRLSFPLVVCTLPSFVLLAIAPAVLGALSTVRGSAP